MTAEQIREAEAFVDDVGPDDYPVPDARIAHLSPEARLLVQFYAFMSSLSEEYYCAGWLISLEYSLYELAHEGGGRFGQGVVTAEEAAQLLRFARETGGWWTWQDDDIIAGPKFEPGWDPANGWIERSIAEAGSGSPRSRRRPMAELIDEIRAENPRLAEKADGGNTLAAIRIFCLGCVGKSRAEVKRCSDTNCPFHPYRFGRNPFRKRREMTDEQRQAAADRFAAARARNEEEDEETDEEDCDD